MRLETVGINIPRLCYDPCLNRLGACRLCVVEIEGIRNLPASCVTWVTPGMVVQTDTPLVIESRKTLLELLVANHPMDCLTCEKLGECKLSEYCYNTASRRAHMREKNITTSLRRTTPSSSAT